MYHPDRHARAEMGGEHAGIARITQKVQDKITQAKMLIPQILKIESSADLNDVVQFIINGRNDLRTFSDPKNVSPTIELESMLNLVQKLVDVIKKAPKGPAKSGNKVATENAQDVLTRMQSTLEEKMDQLQSLFQRTQGYGHGDKYDKRISMARRDMTDDGYRGTV
jgi:hypothetical protein